MKNIIPKKSPRFFSNPKKLPDSFIDHKKKPLSAKILDSCTDKYIVLE